MVQVSTDDVRHLAALSALTIADDEIEALRADLANILTYVHKLGELDTEGVEPTYQVTGLSNIWRDDEVEAGIPADKLVGLAPEHDGSSIKVPKVL